MACLIVRGVGRCGTSGGWNWTVVDILKKARSNATSTELAIYTAAMRAAGAIRSPKNTMMPVHGMGRLPRALP
jgi:hypothetical protein